MPRIIVERNIEVPMRDGCVLRADLFRPDTPDKLPVLLNRTPYNKAMPMVFARHARRSARRRGRLQRDGAGLPRAVRLGGRVELLHRRSARRLRHDRVGRAPALGQRQRRHLRRVVHGRDAVARGDHSAAESEGDGAVDHRQRLSRRMDLPGRRVLAVLQRELDDGARSLPRACCASAPTIRARASASWAP